ncbi:MAG: hypothetical protein R2705_11635 [Ilumatobacteraceae bacterium]
MTEAVLPVAQGEDPTIVMIPELEREGVPTVQQRQGAEGHHELPDRTTSAGAPMASEVMPYTRSPRSLWSSRASTDP